MGVPRAPSLLGQELKRGGVGETSLPIPLFFKRTTEASQGFLWRASGLFFSRFLPFSWQVACWHGGCGGCSWPSWGRLWRRDCPSSVCVVLALSKWSCELCGLGFVLVLRFLC